MTTYTAADNYIKARTNLPTSLSSAEISAAFSAKVRAQSFFSARVAEASILDGLRRISDSYSRGEINLAQARTNAKLMLAKSGLGYVPDDVADPKAGPPAGIDPEDWKAAKSISNLGSTARLDLIFRQNAAMANAVGERENFMDPDTMERWPYVRYHSRDDARTNHRALDGKVFRKDDPFLLTHWPPWDFNCRCYLEEVADGDFDPAELASPVRIDDDNYKLDINGHLHHFGPNASGYKFDIGAASDLCDLSRIADDDARRAVIDAAQVEFGDIVQVKDNMAKLRDTKNVYSNFADLGLDSALNWQNLPAAPETINYESALEQLRKGINITAADGRAVTLGQALLDHWHIEKNKPAADVAGRLEHLPWAIETLLHPRERWDQDTQSVYLQAFAKDEKYRGCMVTVAKNGNARTYFINKLKDLDKCRKGKSHEKF